MLRDEDRVAAKRRLLAVVLRRGGRKPLHDEFRGMRENNGKSLGFKIGAFACAQPEALAKRRMPESGE